ncbi:MAG: MYXO-CTERM sorting domain-containing protein [Nannocystaceae bacterium]
MQSARKVAISMGLGLGLASSVAHASNGTKPRIPVDWTGSPCLTIVDRSADPVLLLPYAIPQEDTDLTEDEVEDSRTHQFFGFCRARDPQTFLPRWITQSDIDRAAAIGAAPPTVETEDILDAGTTWAGCFARINADDDRRPITFAAAEAGVEWDTTGLPAGTYTVEGYTWEPPINVWSLRGGVVKVVDDPALEASAPALAVSNTEEVINRNESVTINGCVSAMEGSTVTAYWAYAAPDAQWVPFLEDDPVVGDDFAVEFTPPEEVAGESVLIRVDVQDPTGRSYTNFMRELVIVLGTDGPGACEDGGVSFIGGAGCGETGGATEGDGSSGGTGDDSADTGTGTAPGQDGGDDGGGGCSCRTSSGDGEMPLSAAALTLLVLGWRRRRRT